MNQYRRKANKPNNKDCTYSFVAHHEIAAVGKLGESLGMGTNALVTCNQDVEHFGPNKRIQVLFDRLSIGFGNRKCLDCALSEPFDEFIGPVLDERAWANDNHALGRRGAVGCNARL